MDIIELKERADITENIKLSRIDIQYRELIKELRKKELPNTIIELVNQDIEDLNSTPLTSNEFGKSVKQKQVKIIKLLEKELKIVPKNHYRKLWGGLWSSLFAIPFGIGVALDLSLVYLCLIGIGFPVGAVIGVLWGSRMDTKASKEGRQLDTLQ